MTKSAVYQITITIAKEMAQGFSSEVRQPLMAMLDDVLEGILQDHSAHCVYLWMVAIGGGFTPKCRCDDPEVPQGVDADMADMMGAFDAVNLDVDRSEPVALSESNRPDHGRLVDGVFLFDGPPIPLELTQQVFRLISGSAGFDYYHFALTAMQLLASTDLMVTTPVYFHFLSQPRKVGVALQRLAAGKSTRRTLATSLMATDANGYALPVEWVEQFCTPRIIDLAHAYRDVLSCGWLTETNVWENLMLLLWQSSGLGVVRSPVSLRFCPDGVNSRINYGMAFDDREFIEGVYNHLFTRGVSTPAMLFYSVALQMFKNSAKSDLRRLCGNLSPFYKFYRRLIAYAVSHEDVGNVRRFALAYQGIKLSGSYGMQDVATHVRSFLL